MATPNKSLGQHWLHDSQTLRNIVANGDINESSHVLEVGPGLGTLTREILTTGASVTAVEFDSDLANGLPRRCNDNPRLTVVEHDILTFDLTSLPKDYIVIANIPYYLTSKLVRLLCESANPPKTAVLLVQKEVAERIASTPGAMSILSISAQVYNIVTLGDIVTAELFTPPPKVDSQVVILTRRAKPLVGDDELHNFFLVVKAGFSERRKKLRSSLSGGLRIEKPQVDKLLQTAGIDGNLRAQELSVEDWLIISRQWQTITSNSQ